MRRDVGFCFPEEENLGSVCFGVPGRAGSGLRIRLPAALPHKYDRALMTEQYFRHQVLRAAQAALRCSSNEQLI